MFWRADQRSPPPYVYIRYRSGLVARISGADLGGRGIVGVSVGPGREEYGVVCWARLERMTIYRRVKEVRGR